MSYYRLLSNSVFRCKDGKDGADGSIWLVGDVAPDLNIEANEKEIDLQKAIEIVKSKAGLEERTIKYMREYEYGDELIKKLAKAME